jgi:hypothetical protein
MPKGEEDILPSIAKDSSTFDAFHLLNYIKLEGFLQPFQTKQRTFKMPIVHVTYIQPIPCIKAFMASINFVFSV